MLKVFIDLLQRLLGMRTLSSQCKNEDILIWATDFLPADCKFLWANFFGPKT